MRIARILIVLLAAASPTLALSNRVFVKSTGMDVGTCPLTAPCRSFSYAMTQVAAAGEVIALDTAGYGMFSVTQSVSVFAPTGVTAFIAGTALAAVDITAAPTDAIILRGLALTANGGNTGISLNSGGSLSVENCIINGFPSYGVALIATGDTSNPRIRIEHSTIRFNGDGVVTLNSGMASPQGGPPPVTVALTISNSSLSENTVGLYARDNTRAAVSDTVFSGNFTGVLSASNANLSYADVNLERCTIAQNRTCGVQAGIGSVGFKGQVRIAHNLITGNVLGVDEEIDGLIMSMNTGAGGTNTIEGNATNGTLTGTYTAK